MNRLEFKVEINAPKEKIWKVLWNDDTYTEWTGVFCEGSYTQSDWTEGGKILFLSPSGEGMYSTILKKTPNQFMSFRHDGMVKEGKELPLDEETRKWSGAEENYTLKEKDGSVELLVEMDIAEQYQDYFKEAFPKGLQKVKELSEN